jgi:hypothetical protein
MTSLTRNLCASPRIKFTAIGLLIICSATLRAKAQETTLTFPMNGGMVDVTFDAARTPAEDVRRWMQLRDFISNENGYQVPFWLEQCFPDDPRYVPCSGDTPSVNVNNAQLNLDRIRTIITDLDPKRFPSDLSPVVSYLKEIQNFALWKETQRLRFFQTGNATYLESTFGTIDPKAACNTILDQIRRTTDKEQASNLVRHDWANCVWREEMKRIGPYPKSAWDSFVADHGIRERVRFEHPN